MTNKEKIADLLRSQPLYRKVTVDTEFLNHPSSLEDLSFSFYCPIDNSNQTFKLILEPEKFLRVEEGKLDSRQYENLFKYFDQADMKYKFTQHYSAACQYCKKYQLNFLLQIETDKSIPLNIYVKENHQKPVQVVKKIGQFPPYQITPLIKT